MLFFTVSLLFMLWTKNPLFAILGLISVFINSSVILLSLNVNFLALIYVIIYVGAICVLFLFVIMLLNIRHFDIKERNMTFLPFILGYLIYLGAYFFVVSTNLDTNLLTTNIYKHVFLSTEIMLIAEHLIERPIVLLLVILLLLLAIISPIVIASKRVVTVRKQDLYYAQTRDFLTTILTTEQK